MDFIIHKIDGTDLYHSDGEWDNHRYYTKIKMPNGSYRYFYTREEYAAYLKDTHHVDKQRSAREAAQRQSVEATREYAKNRAAQNAQNARENAIKKTTRNSKVEDAQAAREAAAKKSTDSIRTQNRLEEARKAEEEAKERARQGQKNLAQNTDIARNRRAEEQAKERARQGQADLARETMKRSNAIKTKQQVDDSINKERRAREDAISKQRAAASQTENWNSNGRHKKIVKIGTEKKWEDDQKIAKAKELREQAKKTTNAAEKKDLRKQAYDNLKDVDWADRLLPHVVTRKTSMQEVMNYSSRNAEKFEKWLKKHHFG